MGLVGIDIGLGSNYCDSLSPGRYEEHRDPFEVRLQGIRNDDVLTTSELKLSLHPSQYQVRALE